MIRPPIVTILGHVDHGKTTLLDTIRNSRLASKEHGGITQRIGGYEINTEIKGYDTDKLTFIDTPGHEAFSKLRSRGANVADIAILIIDGVDSVKPQTVESIAHIKNAGIPFIVAINKVDMPDANTKKVCRDLLKHEVVTEEMGGPILSLGISAKTGQGIKELLEAILLLSSDLKLECDHKGPVTAYIVETKKDIRGLVVSCIIKNGTIKIGDNLFTNTGKVKVRSLINDKGEQVKEVVPSTPFEVLGFSEIPEVGSLITSEEQALKIKKFEAVEKKFDINALYDVQKEQKQLSVILKADSQGTLDAIVSQLEKNPSIKIVLSAVGSINRSDIFLAKTTKAIVIGFSIAYDNEVKSLAKQEKVIIKTYNIIYELIDELEEVADILLEKEIKEKSIKGQAKILATFVIEGETIYGGLVTKGKINIGDNVDLYRADNLINKSKLVSLKVKAKTVSEVKKDQECGMVFSPKLDIKVGDVVQFTL